MLRKSKERDHLSLVGVASMLAGVIIIAGIVYTYMNRPPAVIEHLMNIRQIFEDHFR